ncbi:MAG TPA: patatin-like phospholipase family protein [Ramlibacter sp.]|uniref:patatin-like phospholipase family protein n=1 Tax=Ramlibacter sp. TaxID=1917967 RepID=UPI002BCB345F|nr:patatin-like phospholipase family protein [Ramlibacter sp.]HVZ43902.1 patatin-like phospholipase family protein [Ramlibacter sp.]
MSARRPRAARARAKRDVHNEVKTVNLALQGGGAHGAFAWGVLDRMIEDGRIAFEGISATSAGAMNAAVLAWGWTKGGRDGARHALTEFWRDVSHTGMQYSPYRGLSWLSQFGMQALDNSFTFALGEMWTRMFSPYELNPANFNPLRSILDRHVDFAALRAGSAIKLFLCATNVETCKVRIFEAADVTADAVLASACLPFLFQAVEIEGQYYWDGGYMGNPAIFPLIYDCDARDVVIVHLNPVVREGCPRTAAQIMNRINEVSFNSSLMREMRAIAFVTSLIERGKLSDREFKKMLIHSIRCDEEMLHHGVASKFNPDWGFLCHLRDKGREYAEAWLAAHFERIGRESSVDVRSEFL